MISLLWAVHLRFVLTYIIIMNIAFPSSSIPPLPKVSMMTDRFTSIYVHMYIYMYECKTIYLMKVMMTNKNPSITYPTLLHTLLNELHIGNDTQDHRNHIYIALSEDDILT